MADSDEGKMGIWMTSALVVGTVIGAAIFMLAQDYLAGLSPVYWQLGIGILLIVVVLFARGGVLGGLAALRERIARGRR